MAAACVARVETPRPVVPESAPAVFRWDRSAAIGLAGPSCATCYGLGLRNGRMGLEPCNCVLRAIFRACHNHFRHCSTKEKYMSKITLDFLPGSGRNFSWGRRDEEFCADFELVARRSLDAFHYQVFRLHFLLGADWKLCCWRIGTDRGNFFHAVYRIQQELGRIFRELTPYALFPVDDYYFSHRHQVVAPTRYSDPVSAESGRSSGPACRKTLVKRGRSGKRTAAETEALVAELTGAADVTGNVTAEAPAEAE